MSVIWAVFPAEVEVPGVGLFRGVKACWDGSLLSVWQASGQDVSLAWSGAPTPTVLQHPTAPAHMVSTLDLGGAEVSVRREGGCGCGSPLKAWEPR